MNVVSVVSKLKTYMQIASEQSGQIAGNNGVVLCRDDRRSVDEFELFVLRNNFVPSAVQLRQKYRCYDYKYSLT
jgi:hypothetical protein